MLLAMVASSSISSTRMSNSPVPKTESIDTLLTVLKRSLTMQCLKAKG